MSIDAYKLDTDWLASTFYRSQVPTRCTDTPVHASWNFPGKPLLPPTVSFGFQSSRDSGDPQLGAGPQKPDSTWCRAAAMGPQFTPIQPMESYVLYPRFQQ